jgi:hypothetical protein
VVRGKRPFIDILVEVADSEGLNPTVIMSGIDSIYASTISELVSEIFRYALSVISKRVSSPSTEPGMLEVVDANVVFTLTIASEAKSAKMPINNLILNETNECNIFAHFKKLFLSRE